MTQPLPRWADPPTRGYLRLRRTPVAYCPPVRRWGPSTFGVYVPDGSWFGQFAGVADGLTAARRLAAQATTQDLGRRLGVPPMQTAAPPTALNPDDVSRDRSHNDDI